MCPSMFCCSHEALKYIRVGKVKNIKRLSRFTSMGVLCCWPRLLLPYPVKPQKLALGSCMEILRGGRCGS